MKAEVEGSVREAEELVKKAVAAAATFTDESNMEQLSLEEALGRFKQGIGGNARG